MGFCNCAEANDYEMSGDVARPTMVGVIDLYKRFELRTIFASTRYGCFERAVKTIAGSKEYVTLEDLADEIGTERWLAAKEEGSDARKLLSLPMFTMQGTDNGRVKLEVKKLIAFGMMNCSKSRSLTSRIQGLYALLQNGGPEKHP